MFLFLSSLDSFQRKTWGRKRHALVDTQGNLLAVKVTGAEKSDQEGGRALLEPLREMLPRITLIWGDSHYGGTFRMWAKITLGWMIQTIKALTVPKRGLLVNEGEEVDWEKLFPSGFRPQPRRWVVERTFAWIGKHRRMSKDYEYLTSSSESMIYLAMIRLLLRRLAKSAGTTKERARQAQAA